MVLKGNKMNVVQNASNRVKTGDLKKIYSFSGNSR